MLAVKAMETLVVECGEHLALFAADVVAMIEGCLESNTFELQVAGCEAFVAYAGAVDGSVGTHHKWLSFVQYFSAMCWKQAATGLALVRPGLSGLRAVISHSAFLDTQLVDVLSSIVPAIVSNMEGPGILPKQILNAHPLLLTPGGGADQKQKKRRRRRKKKSKSKSKARKGKEEEDESSFSSGWSSDSVDSDSVDTMSSSSLVPEEVSLGQVVIGEAAVQEMSESELAGLTLYEMGEHANSTTLRTILETLLEYFTDGNVWKSPGVEHIERILRVLMVGAGSAYRFVPVQSALDYLCDSPRKVRTRVVRLVISLLSSPAGIGGGGAMDTSTALQILNKLVAAGAGAEGEGLRGAVVEAVLTLSRGLRDPSERLELLLFLGGKLSFCAGEEGGVLLLDGIRSVVSTIGEQVPVEKMGLMKPVVETLIVATSATSSANRVRAVRALEDLVSLPGPSGEEFEVRYGSRVRYALYFMLREVEIGKRDVEALMGVLFALVESFPAAEITGTLPMMFRLQADGGKWAGKVVGPYLRRLGEVVRSAELVDYVDRNKGGVFEKEVVASCLMGCEVVKREGVDVEGVLGSRWSSVGVREEHEGILARRRGRRDLLTKLAAVARMVGGGAPGRGVGVGVGEVADLAGSDVELFAEMFAEGGGDGGRGRSAMEEVVKKQSFERSVAACGGESGGRMGRVEEVLGGLAGVAEAAAEGGGGKVFGVVGSESSELEDDDVVGGGGYAVRLPRWGGGFGPFGGVGVGVGGGVGGKATPLPKGVKLVREGGGDAMGSSGLVYDFGDWQNA